MRKGAWGTALGAWVCIAGWLGCDAIVGIQDGILAPSDGGGNDGADVTTGDGNGGHDATGDTTTTDGGLDALAEAEAGVTVAACNLVPNSTMVVDDLSTHDGGDREFAHALGITALKNVNGEAIVVTQTQSENQDILAYRASYGNGPSPPVNLAGVATSGGVQIQDTISDPAGNGNVVLTSFVTGFVNQPAYGLQLIPLPNLNNDQFSQGGYELVNLFLANVNQAHALQTSSSSAIWVASTTGESFFRSNITVGAGFTDDAAAANVNVLTINGTSPNWSVDFAPFVVGNGVYVIANQATEAGAGVYSTPMDFSDAATLGTIGSPSLSLVFKAHASVGSPGKALVFAGTLDTQGNFDLYGATVDPGMLGSLTVGQPPFTGGTVSLGDMPFDRGDSVWATDELFAIGTPGDKSVGAVLVWIAPDGHLVSAASTSGGKLIQTNNAIQLSAVAAQTVLGEGHAELVVAWIERIVPDGGAQPYDVLYSAQAVCNKPTDGG
jgi:hypothetical protein